MTATGEIWTLARERERDRYLAALRAPRRCRASLVALAAFAAELGRIPDLVSEPMLGEIRLQWWRDALAVGDGEAQSQGHPVAAAVVELISRHNLPGGLLTGLIDACTLDLYDEPIADMQALTSRLAKTEGALFDLAARLLGAGYSAPLAHAVGHAGKAYGLARLLYALPRDLSHGRVHVPVAALRAHDIEPHALLSGQAGPSLSKLVAELSAEACEAQVAALVAVKALERHLLPAFLPIAMVDLYLAAAARQSAEGPAVQHEINPLGRVWRIWRGLSWL